MAEILIERVLTKIENHGISDRSFAFHFITFKIAHASGRSAMQLINARLIL